LFHEREGIIENTSFRERTELVASVPMPLNVEGLASRCRCKVIARPFGDILRKQLRISKYNELGRHYQPSAAAIAENSGVAAFIPSEGAAASAPSQTSGKPYCICKCILYARVAFKQI
jgi:hypothetical protein